MVLLILYTNAIWIKGAYVFCMFNELKHVMAHMHDIVNDGPQDTQHLIDANYMELAAR